MSSAHEQKAYVCSEHAFVIVVRADEMSSRGSPGHRVRGCEVCDKAVDDAMRAAGWEVPA